MSETQMIRDLQEQVKNLTVSRESSKRALDHYLKTNTECERLRRQLAQVMKDSAAAKEEHAKALGVLTMLNKDLATRLGAAQGKPVELAEKPREDDSGV